MKSNRTKLILWILIFVIGSLAALGIIYFARRERGESISMRAVELFFRLKGKGDLADADRIRRAYQDRVYPEVPDIPRRLLEKCDIDETRIQGHRVIKFSPKQNSSGLHIIYTHGGTYINELSDFHWDIIEQLIDHTGAFVTVPIYPLAPEHSYKETYALLDEVYRSVIADTPANKVILCGDSAGGGPALGQALRYRDAGVTLPGRIILFSPWLDITVSNPEVPAILPSDPLLATAGPIQAGEWWADGDDRRSPLLSPLFADVSGLPPIDVYQGTHDISWPDTRLFKERVLAAGGQINLYEYPGAIHVFVAATFTPEAKDAYKKIAASVKPLAEQR